MKKLTITQQIGANIKAKRKIWRLTQEEFGYMLDLTRASIINIETGRQSPALERFLKLCFILKCTPNDILPLNEDFTIPAENDFKAIKLDAKSKKIQSALDRVKKQQDELAKYRDSGFRLGE